LRTCDARAKGREIVRKIAEVVAASQPRTKGGAVHPGDSELRTWLVTDFVTLGSPLTHAYYLMCKGGSAEQLKEDFEHRTHEREFPTSPPLLLDGDRRLTFLDHGVQRFHHGGQFALTRWTNLYFPASQLLWGDPIGGAVAPIFGDQEQGATILDVPVYTNSGKCDRFFSHVLYWNGCCSPAKFKAPHIVALEMAIDLADAGTANRNE
jgi:hypothetical protein